MNGTSEYGNRYILQVKLTTKINVNLVGNLSLKMRTIIFVFKAILLLIILFRSKDKNNAFNYIDTSMLSILVYYKVNKRIILVKVLFFVYLYKVLKRAKFNIESYFLH